MIANLITLILGLIVSRYLFWRLPTLNKADGGIPPHFSVSVIIPARNEAGSLPLLLEDLKHQTIQPLEIICVDDGSTDQTRQVILQSDTILVDGSDKPADWMGKAWACLKGGEQAKGELLLFLDADVRMTDEGLANLLSTYQDQHCTISVQPYHCIKKKYEQLSMFFNIIQIGANGTGLPQKASNVGLYGPVILISRTDYDKIGGHKVARHTIVDDLVLGDALTRAGKQYSLFLGGPDLSFRMYGDGIRFLFEGWTKNFATGAGKTPVKLSIPMFVWVTSCTAAPIYTILAISDGGFVWAWIYLAFYGIWVAELHRIAPKVGNFSGFAVLFYPIFMLVFLATFFWSLWKKLFGRQVTWKGRKMKAED
jgi:4,4'-diaponeurosporenoate glycosyltransferase